MISISIEFEEFQELFYEYLMYLSSIRKEYNDTIFCFTNGYSDSDLELIVSSEFCQDDVCVFYVRRVNQGEI